MIKAAAAQRHSESTELLASDVGQRIRLARQERGMSLAQLGGDDLSRSFLSLVELGRSRISLRALSIVADRLQLPMSYFLEDAASSLEVVSELTMDRAEAALRSQNPGEALRLLGNVDVPVGHRGRALWLHGWALIDAGRTREALPVLREAIAATGPDKDAHLYIQLKYTLAMALFKATNYEEALVELRDSLQCAMHTSNDHALIGRITVGIGHILYVQKNFEEALAQYTRARELFDAVDDLDNLAAVYTGLSRIYEQKGEATKALRYSRLSVGIFEAKHNKRHAAKELNAMAGHFRDLEELDTALQYASKAVDWARESRASDVEALAHGTLALTYLKLDRLDDARAEAETAEHLASPDEDIARVDAWVTLGRISERRGDPARADALFQEALQVLHERGHKVLYADTAVAYSLVLRSRGDTDGALKYALEAAQIHSNR